MCAQCASHGGHDAAACCCPPKHAAACICWGSTNLMIRTVIALMQCETHQIRFSAPAAPAAADPWQSMPRFCTKERATRLLQRVQHRFVFAAVLATSFVHRSSSLAAFCIDICRRCQPPSTYLLLAANRHARPCTACPLILWPFVCQSGGVHELNLRCISPRQITSSLCRLAGQGHGRAAQQAVGRGQRAHSCCGLQ